MEDRSQQRLVCDSRHSLPFPGNSLAPSGHPPFSSDFHPQTMLAPKNFSFAMIGFLLVASTTGFGYMNTISSMETRGLPFHDPSGSFPICVLQAQVLTPICIDETHVTQMPPPEKKFFAISGGARFTCGLDYGSRFPLCWGRLQVPALFQNVSYTSLSSGANHCCAIRSNDSRVDCWGEELAIALLEDESLVSVSSGVDFSCGVTQDGEVLCWGYVPDQVPQPKNEIFTSVFVGGYTICGVTSSTGETLCWGQDSSAFMVPAGYKFSRLAGGYHHMCGIRSDNHQVVCWGLNKAQQLQVPRDATFSAISAGDIYTCGVTRDANARLLCWGNNAVQYREIDLHASQAVCTNECGKNQYRVNRTSSPQQCPSLSDKVCLECSACVGGDFEISPCGADSDRKCGMIIGKNNLPASFKGPGRRNPTGLFFIMLPLVVTLSLGITFIGVWACQEYREKLVSNKQRLRKEVISLSSVELRAATNNYSEEMILGRGAFGTVYKGVLQNGHQIAVKRANSSSSHEMFDKELELLGRAHHSCLVNLMGYCQEDKLLVFEFMARGTLLENISNCEWISRMRIAAQAARGLEYLHRYASPSIIHRDVKTANILLDRDWNAHVSDFGLALCGPQGSATHLSNMTIVGTPGYLDPEYGLSCKITAKGDVYSFGVVLLELLSGQKPVDPSRKFQSLVAWVLHLVERREWSSVLDPSLPAPLQPEPLYRAVKLALECSKFASKQRPSMTLVAERLEEIVEAMAGTPLLSISS